MVEETNFASVYSPPEFNQNQCPILNVSREWRMLASECRKKLASVGLPRAFLIATIGALAIFAQYQFWKQPSLGDRANWDYFSQVIARGGVPYRDVVNIKTPLSAYIGAGAIIAARPFGVRDVIAIRSVFLVLIALMAGCTLIVVVRYEGDLGLGLAAGAVLLCFDTFARSQNSGVQPKTPMVLFGLLTLWAIAAERPFLAGACGMVSALSWQPGLLFVGVAVLAFSKYLTSWRDLKAVNVLAGRGIAACDNTCLLLGDRRPW